MKTIIAIFILAFATSGHATGKPDFPNSHDNIREKPAKQSSKTTQSVDLKQSARAEARAQAKASARSSAISSGGAGTGGNAAGGTAIGGNSNASGGSAIATGGQVVVNGAGGNTGLTGRIVPDVSASSPITSTSCRNGITAGGSGNGWGGLIGFFSEDEICELRLLWEQFRTAGQHDKADKLLDGMMLMRCEKLSPDSRKMFGDLCPKTAPAEIQNVAFQSN
ncbi:MAG: hypothetical protein IPL15_11810 [Comamonadaceae bacterium]|uniref:hypothetical protein n=1 Tax=Candidatus Skiveiella danica TaxID=3386177 RepID=UPI00390C3B54|nr:hypothetical protein [Comamonadaceae bacterium]